jgi:hypothetical protein
MVWNKLIAAQSIPENAPRLKLNNEKKYDNKSLNDSEHLQFGFRILCFFGTGIKRKVALRILVG